MFHAPRSPAFWFRCRCTSNFPYPTCWQEHGTLLVFTPGNALEFQRLLYDGSLCKDAVNPKESPATAGAQLSKGKWEIEYHPLVEALVRVDPLAGAPALDACLFEDELASSPVEDALGVLWSWLLWVSRAFFPVDSAKLLSVSCAGKEKRLRRCMIGGWSRNRT